MTKTLEDVVVESAGANTSTPVTGSHMNDLSAGLVYIGKILETHMRIQSEQLERNADLNLRMTNIHLEALKLAREGRHCPHCL